jgi:hypothetical protein
VPTLGELASADALARLLVLPSHPPLQEGNERGSDDTALSSLQAPDHGFEPRLEDSESSVLPLDESGLVRAVALTLLPAGGIAKHKAGRHLVDS